MNKRYEIVDLLKAIGIISVIIGHSTIILPITHLRINEFVYLYQIMLFFFTAGFLYDEKYNEDTTSYIGKRFYGIFSRYFLYNTFFVALHNPLSVASLITAEAYSFDESVISFASGCTLNTREAMLGAFWFLPVLFFSCILFAVVFRFSHMLSRTVHNSYKASILLMIIAMLLFAIIGIYANKRNIFLPYHIQTAFLAVPVIFVGYITKKKFSLIERFLCLPGCIISCVLLYLIVYFNITKLALSRNIIGEASLFYPVTFLGMYFCMCLAKLFQTLPSNKIRKFINFIGQNSFHFMALHFLMFKLLDRAISLLVGDPDSIASNFPYSYNLGLIYTFISVALISIVISLTRRIVKHFR